MDYPAGNVKQQLSSAARTALRNYKCVSFGELRTLLETFNVAVEERTGTINGRDYAGIMYGALTNEGERVGTPIKASRIGRDVGYKALQRYYERNGKTIQQPGVLDHLRKAVGDAKSVPTTQIEFERRLREEHIDVIFRRNETGRIYGTTFIDHQDGIVVNGSRLGKEYTANSFENWFMPEPSQPTEESKEQQVLEPLQYPEPEVDTSDESFSQDDNQSTDVAHVGSLFDVFSISPAHEEEQEIQRLKKQRKRHL